MYPEEKKKRHGYVIYVSTKRRTSPQTFRMQVILYTISETLSENRRQVGLSSTTHTWFRRKTYPKKTCCVSFSFCNFSKTWSPFDTDNHSHDTILKIAEIQSKMVSPQSGTRSPKNALILYCVQKKAWWRTGAYNSWL